MTEADQGVWALLVKYHQLESVLEEILRYATQHHVEDKDARLGVIAERARFVLERCKGTASRLLSATGKP